MYSRLFTLLALLLASGCQAPLTQLQTLSQPGKYVKQAGK